MKVFGFVTIYEGKVGCSRLGERRWVVDVYNTCDVW
jgi:hypothetical protein